MKRAVVVTVLLVTAGLGLRDVARSSPAWCEIADEWVDENVEELPTTLDALERIPVEYRRAVYARLAPDVRSSMWGTHLATSADRFGLSREQEAVLSGMRASMTAAVFVPESSEQKEFIAEWEARVVGAFSAPTAGEIFGHLGERGDWGERASTDTFDCNLDSAFSCNNMTGPETDCVGLSCTETGSGCGFLWLHDCDGMCVEVGPV